MEDSIVVGAPIEKVFAFVADFRNTPKWHRNMKQAGFRSSGPPGAGSEYDWVERFMWKTLDLGGVITSWDPPSSFTWRPHGGPFPMTGGWTFTAVDGGTKVVRFSDTELTGVMKRMPALMTAIAKRQVRQELQALKRLIESGASAAA
jgi:uncharacterized protein YndB with AHSA1/START domain